MVTLRDVTSEEPVAVYLDALAITRADISLGRPMSLCRAYDAIIVRHTDISKLLKN
jgi:hypothetical protein